jgi:hypothetical protein
MGCFTNYHSLDDGGIYEITEDVDLAESIAAVSTLFFFGKRNLLWPVCPQQCVVHRIAGVGGTVLGSGVYFP